MMKLLASRFSLAGFLLVFVLASACVLAQGVKPLLSNGSFEGGGGGNSRGGGVPEWEPFENGYDVDRTFHHEGDQSIRCESLAMTARRGALVRLMLNQKHPTPVQVTGWSRADQVGGTKNGDYAIYIDCEYMDGTPLWGQVAPFSVGTHDWERRQTLVLPAKPIKTLTIYALFRGHVGTAWFDDFEAHELAGAGLFDSQPLSSQTKPTGNQGAVHVAGSDGLALDLDAQGGIVGVKAGGQSVRSEAAGGFFVRDVAADGPLVPLRGATRAYSGKGAFVGGINNALKLRFSAKLVPTGDAISIDGELTDLTKTDRAVTVYLVLPVKADGWQWGQDIRHSETIGAGREYTNQTRINVGATGGLSLYPFGSISNAQNGVGIASQMDWPSVYRIFYNGSTRQFVIAWDFALTGKTAAWPSHNARFRCTLFRIPPGQARWGFRAAAARFYRLNAPLFDRKAKAEGIWIPFTDPSKIERVGDFGVAYHEGDNSIASDDKLGILSFRYTEPMSYWMPMPPAMSRTYENAMTLLEKNAKGGDAEARDFARAVLNSGTQDANGRFNLEFQNQPWANGAVFTLNPNPELPATAEKPTKAFLSYTIAKAIQMYGEAAKKTRGEQDGEYLDSLESWADVQDYRLSNLMASPYPIPFDTDSRRPTLPQWYSTHTFTRFLRDDLHNRGKLLMANTAPVRFSIYAGLLDVMGIETNWLDSTLGWHPDDDATFNFRRTMCGQKPYLLLQNTNFDKFTPDMVEKYFQRSLFYAVYPSMFSVDAANNPYWETPRWYNRDRALFVKYIPLIKRLSAAGWQPITNARSANTKVYVERYGLRLFTLFNDSAELQTTTVTIQSEGIASPTKLTNLITGKDIPFQRNVGTLILTITLKPEEAALLELK